MNRRALEVQLPAGPSPSAGEVKSSPVTRGSAETQAALPQERTRSGDHGKTLIAVQSNTGKLFTVDPNTGATRLYRTSAVRR